MLKKLLLAGVVLVVVLGGAFWWFVLRDDAPPPKTLDDLSGSEATGDVPDELDGTWTLTASDETGAAFRIDEEFAGGVAQHTALGELDDVTGSLTLADGGATVSEAQVTIDLTTVDFTDDPPGRSPANRANAMRNRGLETERFPEASFTLTEPIDLGSVPAEGEEISASATGDLTLHGVTNPVTFDVKAKLVGNTIQVSAEGVPVALADYRIDKPTGFGIASVADEGSFEFLLVFTKA